MILKTNILVIGSGAAGLTAALELSDKFNVLIISKETLVDSSTWYAQGGIAAVLAKEDTTESHIQDTLIAGELPEKELLKLREELLHEISSIAPTFKEFKFFMSIEFTLVDCCFAPILWRLPSIGIKLPVNRHLKPLLDYQKEVFKRPGFLDSLSSLERDLKED